MIEYEFKKKSTQYQRRPSIRLADGNRAKMILIVDAFKEKGKRYQATLQAERLSIFSHKIQKIRDTRMDITFV